MRQLAVVLCGLWLLAPASGIAAESLGFFKNYFVTGDYAVAGVPLAGTGVNGYATGSVSIGTSATPGAAPNYVPPNADILAAYLYWATVDSNPGVGATGAQFGPLGAMADISQIANRIGNPLTPPCWSSGGATGSPSGAIQLSVYRADVLRFIPNDPVTGKRSVKSPLYVRVPDSGVGNKTPITEGASLVVVYRDSASYGDPAMPFKSVVIYDGSFTMNQASPAMTQTLQGFYEASNSAPPVAKMTHIVGNGQANFTEELYFNQQPLATNAFVNGWDNPTFTVNLPNDAATATTMVNAGASSSFDCLSWGAVILSTTVQDTDQDGLLDTWEISGFTDLGSGAFVNLPAMGANPNRKDIFVQLDYLIGADGHSHLPAQSALDMVAGAFRNAPVLNPDGLSGISIHFDVGNHYQSPADPAIIPYQANGTTLAVGGNGTAEASTCTTSTCLFPSFPGTVGWKTGYQFLRDKYLPYSRKDVFHYGLLAHALAIPTAAGSGTPKSISGVSDLLGGDLMVTLGLWDNEVGSAFVQASTLFHELGHNLALRHGGGSQVPNCKPNYESSMNYLFQISGLPTSTGAVTLDYSRTALGALNEKSLSEAAGLGNAPLAYQTRWYVPLGASFLDNLAGTTPATRHCDGSPLNPLTDSTPKMVRVASGTVSANPIDWNEDGTTEASVTQDIDFNGAANESFTGYDDWSHIDLQQIGGRRNVIKLSLDVRGGDLAATDPALGDSGLGDSGLGDSGLGDSGLGDSGLGDSGLGDSGLGTDLDYSAATSLGNAPVALSATPAKQSIILNWNAPVVSAVSSYTIWRAVGAISTSNPPVRLATILGTAPLTYTDAGLKKSLSYTYFVVDNDGNGNQSGPSNLVTASPQ